MTGSHALGSDRECNQAQTNFRPSVRVILNRVDQKKKKPIPTYRAWMR